MLLSDSSESSADDTISNEELMVMLKLHKRKRKYQHGFARKKEVKLFKFTLNAIAYFILVINYFLIQCA